MDTRALNEFLVLAYSKSFREAADKLFISQPALSNHISALEDELGFSLIDREKRPLALTESGRIFYHAARQALKTLDTGIKEGLEALNHYSIRVDLTGAPVDVINLALSIDEKVLITNDFDPFHPLELLDNDKADIVFSIDLSVLPELQKQIKEAGYSCQIGWPFRFNFACDFNHPLAEKMAAGLTREDLCNNTIGVFGSGSLEGYNVLLKKVIGDDLNIEWKYCPIPIAGRAIGITLDKILMVASADMTDRDLVPQKNIVRSSTLDGVPLVS